MDILIIHVIDHNAYEFLNELEKLELIKVLKRKTDTNIKLSDKYSGKLPLDAADKLQAHIKQLRDEWDKK